MKPVTRGLNGVHDVNFDILSFIFGKLNCGSSFNDVVSYLLGKAVSAVWTTITNVAIASFTAVSTMLRELVVDITPVQSGSGDPSPTNVRPISGWTGASITNRGSNILPLTLAKFQSDNTAGTWDGNIYTRNGVLFTINTDSSGFFESITTSGKQTSNTSIGLYLTIPTGHYYMSGCPSGGSVSLSYSLRIIELETSTQIIDIGSGIEFSYDSPTDIYVYIVYNSSFAGSVGQIFTPSVVSDTVHQISWQTEAGTIYGGTLTDNGDGTWTLVRMTESVDLGILSWTRAADAVGGHTFWAALPNAKYRSGSGYKDCLCDRYKGVQKSAGALGDYEMTQGGNYYSNSGNIAIKDETYTSAADFRTAMAGVLLVYLLATPVSYTLTAESVRALLGQNNIFADCGNINTITYRES